MEPWWAHPVSWVPKCRGCFSALSPAVLLGLPVARSQPRTACASPKAEKRSPCDGLTRHFWTIFATTTSQNNTRVGYKRKKHKCLILVSSSTRSCQGVDERASHAVHDVGRPLLVELEDRLYDADLRRCCVQAAKRRPIVRDDTRSEHIGPAVYRSSHQRNLKKRVQDKMWIVHVHANRWVGR